MDENIQVIKDKAVESVDEETIKKIKGFNELFAKVEENYVNLFVSQHTHILPIPKHELIQYC